jgi:hypothetical protein
MTNSKAAEADTDVEYRMLWLNVQNFAPLKQITLELKPEGAPIDFSIADGDGQGISFNSSDPHVSFASIAVNKRTIVFQPRNERGASFFNVYVPLAAGPGIQTFDLFLVADPNTKVVAEITGGTPRPLFTGEPTQLKWPTGM